jgi:hypothetical protein
VSRCSSDDLCVMMFFPCPFKLRKMIYMSMMIRFFLCVLVFGGDTRYLNMLVAGVTSHSGEGMPVKP